MVRLLLPIVFLLPTPAAGPAPLFWGAHGHEMAAGAAVEVLPRALPAFFHEAGPELVYLAPEPDRWRNHDMAAMDAAWSYDHYVDLERIPEAARGAPDRFRYLELLRIAGLEDPAGSAGLLPYRILELYQRLVTEWRLWREADAATRPMIERRIVNDAGILGHYVTDGSQPQHTTIHFNGWSRDAPNPRGFTYAHDFHYRFETAFVDARVGRDQVERYLHRDADPVTGHAGEAVWSYLLETHRQVEHLYELEQAHGFDPDGPASPELVSFTARRLAAAADMLRTLWWSAWLESTAGTDR